MQEKAEVCPQPGGGGASSAASSTTSSGAGSPAFEPIKKFMKKLEDGTEYLFRTEERDKDGNLVKSIRYAKDGKTIERVREFKMAPAGVTDPARNVVASEIRYDKEGKVIYKRLANEDLSGYTIERTVDKDAIRAKVFYRENFEGNRYRATAYLGEIFDNKTGLKRYEAEFGSQGTDDMKIHRTFDKKTGTKVVQEMERVNDDSYKATIYGDGKSKQVSIHREVPGKEDEVLQTERYDSKGRLRFLYTKTRDGSFTRVENPVKGRVTIIEEINGENFVTKKYKKNGEEYTQKFIVDNANPENNKLEVYKGDELVHTVTSKTQPATSSAADINPTSQSMIDIVFSRKVDADDVRNLVARTSPDGTKEWNSAGELIRDGDVQYRYQGALTISGSDGEHAWRTLDFGNGRRTGYIKIDNEWIKTGEDMPIH